MPHAYTEDQLVEQPVTLLTTMILLLSKTFDLRKQETIKTEAQLRQAAKEALEADMLFSSS